MKNIRVVSGILRNQAGEILIAKRQPGKHLAGLWEFPGGKIEANEASLDALVRELYEELNVNIIEAKPLTEVIACYPTQKIILEVWQVAKFSGNAIGKEGQEIRWVNSSDLSNYPFPEVNQRIFDKLYVLEKN